MTNDISPTYLDLKLIADKAQDLCAVVNTTWSTGATEVMFDILDEVISNPDGIKDYDDSVVLEKIKEIGLRVEEKIHKHIAEVAVESYNCGYAEGSHDSARECAKTIVDLTSEGYINEENWPGSAMKLASIIKDTSDKAFAERTKGKTLQVDPSILGLDKTAND